MSLPQQGSHRLPASFVHLYNDLTHERNRSMSLALPFLTPFVGREEEKRLYQQLLTQSNPWVLLITGQGGIGKSRLLARLAEETPQNVVTLKLNFAIPSLRIDPLTVLEELLPQSESFVDAQQMQHTQQVLADGRSKLSHPAGNLTQEIHLAESASFQGQGMQLNINTAIVELRRQIRAQATQAFYDLLLTLASSRLVLLLDTCEWLGEAEASEVGQWLLNDLLPSLHERLHRKGKRCHVVMTSRMPLSMMTIRRQEVYAHKLPFLDQSATDDYLLQIGVTDTSVRQRLYDITHGHALCVEIIGLLWQQQGDRPLTIADLPQLQDQFNEQALLEYLQPLLYQRLPSPFRELTKYSVLLRSFDLPMLEAMFDDLLPPKSRAELFEQFIRYPYIEARGHQRYACHDLIRNLQAPRIRVQEPAQWQQYHQRALTHLADIEPYPLDWYYHAIVLNEEQGISLWEEAVQGAYIRDNREYFSALLEVAHDETLDLTPGSSATRANWQGRFYAYGFEMQAALVSYEQAIELFRAVGSKLGEANVRKAIGDVQQFRDEREAALVSYEQALELFRAVGDRLGEANVRKAIGDVQQFRKEMQAALVSYEQALELFRAVGDRLGEANVRQAIGDVQQFRKEMQAALVSYEQALELFRAVGSKLGEANVRKAIGDVQQFRKEMQAALVSYEQALELFRAVGSKLGEANVRKAIGDVQQFRKEMQAALVSYEQALELFRAVGSKLGEANVRKAIGDVQQFRDEREAALVSYEQALELFRAVGSKLGEANVRQAIGDVQQFRKEMQAALVSYEQALELFRAVGSKLGEANVRKAIGDVQQFRKEMQ